MGHEVSKSVTWPHQPQALISPAATTSDSARVQMLTLSLPEMSMCENINITYNLGMIMQVLMEWFYGIDFQYLIYYNQLNFIC